MRIETEKPRPLMGDVELGMMFGVGLAAVVVAHGLEGVHKLRDSLVMGTGAATKGVARLWRNVPFDIHFIKK